jgi:hypothetical protein
VNTSPSGGGGRGEAKGAMAESCAVVMAGGEQAKRQWQDRLTIQEKKQVRERYTSTTARFIHAQDS